eukprot:gene22454-29569_t
MAPKVAKKKKKAKEELEEERRLAEEAARLEEEERLRLEEEERRRLEELERQRLERLDVLLTAEGERLDKEREIVGAPHGEELAPLMGQFSLEKSQAEQQRKKDWEWERFLACTYIPNPLERVTMSDFIAELQSASQPEILSETLVTCVDCYQLMEECSTLQLEASQKGDAELAEALKQDVATLHAVVASQLDQVTAKMLHFSDEQANDRGEIQMGTVQGAFQWSLWVNTTNNPRMKTVEMGAFQWSLWVNTTNNPRMKTVEMGAFQWSLWVNTTNNPRMKTVEMERSNGPWSVPMVPVGQHHNNPRKKTVEMGAFQWSLWVNTTNNPRMKTVEMGAFQWSLWVNTTNNPRMKTVEMGAFQWSLWVNTTNNPRMKTVEMGAFQWSLWVNTTNNPRMKTVEMGAFQWSLWVNTTNNPRMKTVEMGAFQWSLWVNTTNNPRTKTVEMVHLSLVVDIPHITPIASNFPYTPHAPHAPHAPCLVCRERFQWSLWVNTINNPRTKTVEMGAFQWSLWVNTIKNPRTKTVEMVHLSLVVDIPHITPIASNFPYTPHAPHAPHAPCLVCRERSNGPCGSVPMVPGAFQWSLWVNTIKNPRTKTVEMGAFQWTLWVNTTKNPRTKTVEMGAFQWSLWVNTIKNPRMKTVEMGAFQWTLWVNTTKNPRMKTVEMGAFQWSLWVNTIKNPRTKTVEMVHLSLVVISLISPPIASNFPYTPHAPHAPHAPVLSAGSVPMVPVGAFQWSLWVNTIKNPRTKTVEMGAFQWSLWVNTTNNPRMKTVEMGAFQWSLWVNTIKNPRTKTVEMGAFQWTLWVNTTKNPRTKTVEMGAFQWSLWVNTIKNPRMKTVEMGAFQWTLWVNTTKNPRMKTVEMGAFQWSLWVNTIKNPRMKTVEMGAFQWTLWVNTTKNPRMKTVEMGAFQWSLWVNTTKNPRTKTVEMVHLNLVVDIPKSIALANIGMRIQHRTEDEYFTRCTNEFMAVGGVLYAELVSLPPPARKVKSWMLRQVTPLAFNTQRIPYPIPPAGADPATYRLEEEPPPLGFTFPFTPNMLLLDSPGVKVGWWDHEISGWSTQGVTDVVHDSNTGILTFKSNHMGPLAVVQSRVRLLPYQGWSVRPTGGRNGSTASVTLHCGLSEPLEFKQHGISHASLVACPNLWSSSNPAYHNGGRPCRTIATASMALHCGLSEPLEFKVGPSTMQLANTTWPQLNELVGVAMQPGAHLRKLSQHGIHLMPEDRDAGHVGPSTVQLANTTWPQLNELVGVAMRPGVLLRKLSQHSIHLIPEDRDMLALGPTHLFLSSKEPRLTHRSLPPQVGPSTVQLANTTWPQLNELVGVAMRPGVLLRKLSQHGIHLMPEDRDAGHAGTRPKDPDTEQVMCHDLALLTGTFLVSGSRWNQTEHVAEGECLARISEVLDWEEGGRTELKHVERVFTKEKEDGERRVMAVIRRGVKHLERVFTKEKEDGERRGMAVIRRGVKGVAFSDALDRREEYPALIGHTSVEDVQACMETPWGEVHASLLSLLQGPSLDTEEFKESGLVSRLQGPSLDTEEFKESGLVSHLQASPEALELVRATNPLLCETVGQLLSLLRVFSFS